MSEIYWLSDEAWAAIGCAIVDDPQVISSILHALKSGCRWRVFPADYGPRTTIYNRYDRWARQGIWRRLFERLASICGIPDELAIDTQESGPRRLQRSSNMAVLLCVALLGLTGCASTGPPGSGAAFGNVPLECAPFARAVSGIELRGAAADWWPRAEGRFRRTQTPAVGSVLVFRRSTRLPDGHVAVVSRVLSDRRILATHANWVRHQVSEDVPVIDVSPGNDWTRARVWWPPTNQMGVTEYATFGFIQANPPFEHDQISAKTRQLSEVAISE